MSYTEIHTIEQLQVLLNTHERIERYVFQNMDFTPLAHEGHTCRYFNCLFMGCTFNKQMRIQIDSSCFIFSAIDVPYNCFRNHLYNADILYKGYRIGYPESYDQSFDGIVYRHYLEKGKSATDIKETLARSLHDHSISDSLHDLLAHYDERHVVGIMGGHGLLRTDAMYRQIALISKQLTEQGFLMVSGGGPGAMEATHLGAWLAGYANEDIDEVLTLLCTAPTFTHPLWLDTALQVIQRYPQKQYISLGVPTWLYGHEPATPFATHIAKYFENALREDGILTIAKGGIIYSPGSAGTMQEIFQDAVQNHYLSFGYASPMVFLGTHYWTQEMPVYPLLTHLASTGRYRNLLLSLTDTPDEAIRQIRNFAEGKL